MDVWDVTNTFTCPKIKPQLVLDVIILATSQMMVDRLKSASISLETTVSAVTQVGAF